MPRLIFLPASALIVLILIGCQKDPLPPGPALEPAEEVPTSYIDERDAIALAPARPEIYAQFTLNPPVDHLSDNERQMIGLLIEAADIMDLLFWH